MNLLKELTTITPLSKFLAMTLLSSFLFISFYLGMNYQKAIEINQIRNNVSNTPHVQPTPTIEGLDANLSDGSFSMNNGLKTYVNKKLGFSVSIPEGYCFVFELCKYKYGDTYIDIGISRDSNPFYFDSQSYVLNMLSKLGRLSPSDISLRHTVVDSLDAIELHGGLAHGQNQDGITIFIAKGNYMYELAFLSWGQSIENKYQKVLSTFKFIN